MKSDAVQTMQTDVVQQDAVQPDVVQLDAAQQDVMQPDAVQLDVVQLDAAQPDVVQADVVQAEAKQTEAEEPEPKQPKAKQPEPKKPGRHVLKVRKPENLLTNTWTLVDPVVRLNNWLQRSPEGNLTRHFTWAMAQTGPSNQAVHHATAKCRYNVQ